MDLNTAARIDRERVYHNRRAHEETRESQAKYYAAIRDGADEFDNRLNTVAQSADILEYGCGTNSKLFSLARTCRTGVGIDISDAAIQLATTDATALRLTNIRFLAMNAEAMDFPTGSFDVVFGRGIIHHLQTERAFAEIARVLRPGGTALFWEPMGHNILLNTYRRLTPNARTPDEHPLLRSDFEIAQRYFSRVSLRMFGLTSALAVPFRDSAVGEAVLKITGGLDQRVFRIPGMRWQAWYCLMDMSSRNE
jgi:SAM-dependent methyltransferase